jgi:hypothetical protein
MYHHFSHPKLGLKKLEAPHYYPWSKSRQISVCADVIDASRMLYHLDFFSSRGRPPDPIPKQDGAAWINVTTSISDGYTKEPNTPGFFSQLTLNFTLLQR